MTTPHQPHHYTDGWQDIATAPKDGEWVLLYWPTMSMTAYPACGFNCGDEYGWELVRDRDYGEIFPTHWQPLPKPPSTTKSLDGEADNED